MRKDQLDLLPIHPFPARMAPSVVWDALPSSGPPIRVLDPMAGSGTTITTARIHGHFAIGLDTDPLAILIARGWASDVRPFKLVKVAAAVAEKARRRIRHLSRRDAYPLGADEDTRRFVRYWFDETGRMHLAALSWAIEGYSDPTIRQLLWCAFSRLIVVKTAGASLAMDVAHSRPHRVYDFAPVRALDAFERAVEVIANRSPFSDGFERPRAKIRRADARRMPIEDASVDLVITSPPYLNAIDYLRGHKLSLVWMGHSISSLRDVRSSNVGSELSTLGVNQRVSLQGARFEEAAQARYRRALECMGDVGGLAQTEQGMIRRYIADMDGVLGEVARVLIPKGRAVLVVGDSTLKGVFLRNSAALTVLGEAHGLAPGRSSRRHLPDNRRYLPPPTGRSTTGALDRRMRYEVILRFTRQKAGS